MTFPQLISIPHPEWLTPGSPADPRLFHTAPDDKIQLYPAGQGYRQEVVLQDDLSLNIVDYTLHRDTVFEKQKGKKRGENELIFEFQLTDLDTQDRFCYPYLSGQDFWLTPGHQRIFEVEVRLKQPLLGQYCQAMAEGLPEPVQPTISQILEHFSSRGKQKRPRFTQAELLNRLLADPSIMGSDRVLYRPLPHALFGKATDINYAIRQNITPVMRQLIAQILSCPYQGVTRRSYLKRQALKLVSLYLEAMYHPPLPKAELTCIYKAAAILRERMTDPPDVEQLARQVYTNRFKLYRGFHAVYGTTPVGYLRTYRIGLAYQLFYTSDLSVSQVATAVGYSNRSRFATAFRQIVGLKPKAFQLQLQRRAS
ncbi:MAG: AraC family transcriptional regulator [Cyanobacteria bacterium P01_H01_bin.58]